MTAWLALNEVTNRVLEAALDRTKVKVAREDSTTTIVVIEILYKFSNLIDKNLITFILTI